MDEQSVIKTINEYLAKWPSLKLSDFYAGITDDFKRRLFNEHKLKQTDIWIACPCDSKETAIAIEKMCLSSGMQGDTGGGNKDSVWVYCYAVTKGSIEHT